MCVQFVPNALIYAHMCIITHNSGRQKKTSTVSLLWDTNIATMTSCAYSDVITIQWCHVYEYSIAIDASIHHDILLKNYSSGPKIFSFNLGKLMLIISTEVQFTLLSLGYVDKNYQKHFLVPNTLIRFLLFWELGTNARIVIKEMALFASNECKKVCAEVMYWAYLYCFRLMRS